MKHVFLIFVLVFLKFKTRHTYFAIEYLEGVSLHFLFCFMPRVYYLKFNNETTCLINTRPKQTIYSRNVIGNHLI